MSFRDLCRRLVAGLVLASLTGTACAASYTLLDLGVGTARDLNSAGQVVGEAEGGAWHYNGATRTTLRFGAHFLDTPADQLLYFTALSANAINDNGRIVGSVVFIPRQLSTRTAYVFDGGEVATLLTSGDAFGVNGAGSVVGAEGPGFIYSGSGLRLPPGPSARLLAVNDANVAAGSVARAGVHEAATFAGTEFTVLNLRPLNLPSAGPTERFESSACSINNAGQVVGSVKRVTLAGLAVREWGFLVANGATLGLGDLGGEFASPRDLNGGGVIVGTAIATDGLAHAFVHANGVMSDLNAQVVGAYGWLLRSANAINENGWIVGEGLKDGAQHAFLLRPAATAQPPVLNLPPVGANVCAGDAFRLSVSATGPAPLTYQWQHAGTNLPGATTATFAVAAAEATDAGTYRVAVANPFGKVVSGDVLVTVTPKGGGDLHMSVALYTGISISGTMGQRVQILAAESPDDTRWQPVATVTLETSPFLWIDPSSTNRSRRFYRTAPLP